MYTPANEDADFQMKIRCFPLLSIPYHLAKLNRDEVGMSLAGNLEAAAIPRGCIVVEAHRSMIPPDNEILRGFEEYYDSDY